MLNTDQYNPQVKKKMSKPDFIKNNRGIDEGKDVDPAILEEMFDEIATEEIVIKDEQLARFDSEAESPDASRYRTKKEIVQIALANENIALKTEAMFNTIHTKSVSNQSQQVNSPEKSKFYHASHYEHVKSMFQIIWMSVLTGISTPLQKTQDPEMISLCLLGLRYACKICCMFGMDLERKAFITTFSKFTFLTSLGDLKSKNIEAIRVLFDIAYAEGNELQESWREIVLCISQLERLQLFGSEGEQEVERIQRYLVF